MRRSPRSDPAVGPVTNPDGWAAHRQAQRCSRLEGDDSITNTLLCSARSTPLLISLNRVLRPTPCVFNWAVVMTPWWSASHFKAAGVRSDMDGSSHECGAGMSVRATVPEGCAPRGLPSPGRGRNTPGDGNLGSGVLAVPRFEEA